MLRENPRDKYGHSFRDGTVSCFVESLLNGISGQLYETVVNRHPILNAEN